MTGSRNDARADGRGRVYQATGDQHITEYHHHAPDWSGPDSVRHPSVGRAPVVLRDRVGEMDRLRAAVEPGAVNGVYVLHGLGGCGKTAVAYTLFQHATQQAGRIGLWVNASDPASLRAGMLAVAADRGATDAELTGARAGLRPAADLVWQYLDASDRPWLLVLDNADTPAVLRDGGWLRTSPAGTVVVTTRQAASHWWPGAELLQFGVLPREDAARVLQDLAPDAGSAEDAAAVADRLGHLPLALTLAGGFLAHQVIDPWTMADYRNRLEAHPGLNPIDLLDQGATDTLASGSPSGHDSDSGARRLLSRTWQLSLDALTAHGLPEATHLLRLLACWAGDPLPLKVLSRAELAPGLSPARVELALRGLLDHSLTELVPGEPRALRTHGILLDSVAHATPPEDRERLAATATRQLQAVLPEVPERGAQDPAVILLAPHVLAFLRRLADWQVPRPTLEAAADCALRLITAVHRSGDYTSALTLAREAVALTTPGLGADSAAVLRLRIRVGRAIFRLGRFEESETELRDVLERCERALGPDALETLEACLRLVSPLFNLDQLPEAIRLVQRVVTGRTEQLGELHPLTLMARKSMLEFPAARGADRIPEVPEIVGTGPAVIADCRTVSGDDHPMTLGAELNYAATLLAVGDPSGALPHARKAAADYERIYGQNHPLALSACRTLSMVLADLGQYAEAIELGEKLVEGRVRLLGATHPWTITAEEHLRGFRAAAGRSN